MPQTHIEASLGGASLAAPPVRPGLINPATRFRKVLPYVGTTLVLIIAVSGYATMKGMAASRDWLRSTFEVKSELGNLELNRALLHRYAAEAAEGASGEAQAQVRSTAEALRQSLARLRELTRDDAAQQELLGRL